MSERVVVKEAFAARSRRHGADRLERLKRFVLDPVLSPHDRFDFGSVVSGGDVSMSRLSLGERHCGTAGCLIGNAPAAFPDHFNFNRGGEGSIYTSWTWEWAEFFCMTQEEAREAFMPSGASGGKLDRDCTAQEACTNLDLIIARMRAEGVE